MDNKENGTMPKTKMNERGCLRLTLSSQDAVVIHPTDREEDAIMVRVSSILPGEVELMFKGPQEVWRDRLWSPNSMRKHR